MSESVAHPDPRFNETAEALAKSWQIKALPVVVMEEDDARAFVWWMTGLVGGAIIQTSGPYPATSFIETLDRLAYAMVFVDGGLPDDLYLMLRDYALDHESPLRTRFGEYAIHPEHRAAVFISHEDLATLSPDLSRVLLALGTVRHVRSNNAGNDDTLPDPRHATHEGYQLFDDIEGLIAWCDRYYGGAGFLFRGQAEDWPLDSPLARLKERPQAELASKRTRRFLQWARDHAEFAPFAGSELELPAVAQHFGLPTGLLDLTRTARVAAHFAATGRGNPDRHACGVVYVFSEHELRKFLGAIGGGPHTAEVDRLRRMRHQQGLFVSCHGNTLTGCLLTKLFFRHVEGEDRRSEAILLPREFIFPPYSPLEKKVQCYLLAESARALIEPRPDAHRAHAPGPALSVDPSGWVIRSYLDQTPLAHGQPIPNLFQNLDGNYSILSLASSYLVMHQDAMWRAFAMFGASVGRTPGDAVALGKALMPLRDLMSEFNRPRDADVSASPAQQLSIRDLVDGLATYYTVRQTIVDPTPDKAQRAFSNSTRRLWNAYSLADTILGDEAWTAFGPAVAFAMCCVDPVRAFVAAIAEIGRHGVTRSRDHSAAAIHRNLAFRTGHEPVSVEDAVAEFPLIDIIALRLEQAAAVRGDHPEVNELIAGAVHDIRGADILLHLMAPMQRHPNGSMGIQHWAQQHAEAMASIEMVRSVAEGLVGHGSTMLCPHGDCPYHALRVCGRVSAIPASSDTCRYRTRLRDYRLTPETLAEVSVPLHIEATGAPSPNRG